ncbi:hypothetical protein [Candidatus Phytoplasma meliae]|nr:hypothetical protein [Candidatus Phytoplasma meliae]
MKQNNEINVYDVANYIIEKTTNYPCFFTGKKNQKTDPKNNTFYFTNYILSLIVYYVYVESLLKKRPLFIKEKIIASRYGTIYPTLLDFYPNHDSGYLRNISFKGDSNKLTKENKALIDSVFENIVKLNSSKKLIDINRQQRAYFQTRYPKHIQEIMTQKLEFTAIEYDDLNDVMKKTITDECIIESFIDKENFFTIDKDCCYERVPEFFHLGSANYMPKGLKILNNFKY